MKESNGIRGWLVLGALCLGGSTGGTYLRPHNPKITTEAWLEMKMRVEKLSQDMFELRVEVRGLAQELARQRP